MDKFFNDDIEAKVVTKVEGRKKKIEITIPTKNFIVRSEELRDEIEEAIDLAIDKIEGQIRKNKTKIKNKIEKTKYIDITIDEEDIVEDDNNIIKRKTIESKPMTEDEAILQMNLLNHDIYMCNNVETNNISVVYRRKDGNYGIINSK